MRSRPAVLALILAAAAAVGLAALGIAFGAVAAQGWLCAFVLVATAPLGSLALLLVHGVTGGRWGHDLAPAAIPAARCIPLLLLAVVPVLVFRPFIYQWHELGRPEDVFRFYLNPPFFDARTVIALAIWSALAWSEAWRSQLLAGLGLIVHLILMTFIPADWVLTLSPGAVSAGFGLGFGIEQIAAALAFFAVLGTQGDDARANRDLAGMLVASLLGTMYFVYMQFLVIWYGNGPEKVHWYAVRAEGGWQVLALAAFLVGAAFPFLAVLNPFVRGARSALRLVGGLVLGGIAMHVAWLTAPAFGAVSLAPAGLAVLAMALPLAVAARLPLFRRRADGNAS